MFLPKEVGRRIVFLLLFLSISVLVPLESQSTRGLYYEIIVISWALMTVLLLSEDRFQPSEPLPSALFNYYITGSGGGERFAVERQHKEFKHFWNCFRSFSPSHSSESCLNTCWRWILIRQWNQLNLMQHLLSPRHSAGFSSAAHVRPLSVIIFLMFASLVMNVGGVSEWVIHNEWMANGMERALITCVSYQV